MENQPSSAPSHRENRGKAFFQLLILLIFAANQSLHAFSSALRQPRGCSYLRSGAGAGPALPLAAPQRGFRRVPYSSRSTPTMYSSLCPIPFYGTVPSYSGWSVDDGLDGLTDLSLPSLWAFRLLPKPGAGMPVFFIVVVASFACRLCITGHMGISPGQVAKRDPEFPPGFRQQSKVRSPFLRSRWSHPALPGRKEAPIPTVIPTTS